MVDAERQRPASGRSAPIAASATATTPAVLDRELEELRVKARHIAGELAALDRRMRELRRQIEAHQKRRSTGYGSSRGHGPGDR